MASFGMLAHNDQYEKFFLPIPRSGNICGKDLKLIFHFLFYCIRFIAAF